MLDRVVSSGLCKQQCSILSTSLHFATTAESFCVFFFFRAGGGDDFAIRWERDTWPYLHEILRALHYHARDVSMYPRFLEETGMNARQ